MNSNQLTVIEVMQIHAMDSDVHHRHQGAPFLKAYAPPLVLGRLIEEFDRSDAELVLARYAEDRAPHETGHRLIQDINGLMKWAREKGYRSSQFQPIRRPRPRTLDSRMLGAVDLDRMLLHLDQVYQSDFRLRVTIRAMAILGLESSQAIQFSMKHLDHETWEYRVHDSRGRFRCIPVPSTMRPFMNHMRRLESTSGGEAWPRLTGADLRKAVQRLGSECGFAELTPALLAHIGKYGEVVPP